MIAASYLDGRLIRFETALKKGQANVHSLKRQGATAKGVLQRLRQQKGVLVADDAGLGKTWTTAMVALSVAQKGGRVLILVPNAALLEKWETDLHTVRRIMPHLDGTKIRLQQKVNGSWAVTKLRSGTVVIMTFTSYTDLTVPKHVADLLVIDEAHRSKSERGLFRGKLSAHRAQYGGIVLLTATPLSIALSELCATLDLVAGHTCENRDNALRSFAEFARKSALGEQTEFDVADATRVWQNAIANLKPWVIRHTIDDVSPEEAVTFGKRDTWEMNVSCADEMTVDTLARIDRVFGKAEPGQGLRGNDPRYHVGWDYLRMLLSPEPEQLPLQLQERNTQVKQLIADNGKIAVHHMSVVQKWIRGRRHPKIYEVATEVARIANRHEKVLVFCHHHATARELTEELNHQLRKWPPVKGRQTLAFRVWDQVWQKILPEWSTPGLRDTVLEWIRTPSFRAQVVSWLNPRLDLTRKLSLETALRNSPIRKARSQTNSVPSILQAVCDMAIVTTHDTEGVDVRTSPIDSAPMEWKRVANSESDDDHAAWKLFNSPFGPDVLVATDKLSEGIDLHRFCRHLVHYELDPSPVRVRQREGRVRRIGSWASIVNQPIQYAYPSFGGTRDEALVRIVKDRLNTFDLLLGGSPKVLDVDRESDIPQNANLLEQLKRSLGAQIHGSLAIYLKP